MKKIGIYVHIPFCKQKCYYCDFCSYADKLHLQEEYANAIIGEIDSIKQKDIYQIKTIYIGGGTPSIINPDLIKKIILKIKNSFKVLENVEITLEVNPGTIDNNKVLVYKQAGINRISMGLQSTNDALLRQIGRIHNFNDFEVAYSLIQNNGFTNINIDLMIGLPNQTLEDVKKSVKKIIEKNPKHISVYSLIVEPETKMEKLIETKKLALPDENVEREMYWTVKNLLEKNGFFQYEISNFSREGFESKHNLDCWNQEEYIGLGAAAHSYLDAKRYSNTQNIEEYIQNAKSGEFEKNKTIHEVQSKEDMMREYIILGLRKIEGISVESFIKKFNMDPLKLFKNEINKNIKEGLIELKDNKIRLTSKGIDFANIVWEEFI